MKIAFLGDSITFGYALADKTKRYSTLVKHQDLQAFIDTTQKQTLLLQQVVFKML